MKALMVALLLSQVCQAQTKVFLHEAGNTEQIDYGIVGAKASSLSYMSDVLHYWAKTKECWGVVPVLKPDGANFDAALTSDKIGLMPRVSYLVSDKDSKVISSKTVSPKNAAKDICKAVARSYATNP